MKFSVTKVFRMEMAHILTVSYSMECQKIHGHSYKLEVTVVSSALNEQGVVCDFKLLKEAVEPLIRVYDHSFLKEEDIGFNPTAENLAKFIFIELVEQIKRTIPNASLERIRLWETDTCYVTVEN